MAKPQEASSNVKPWEAEELTPAEKLAIRRHHVDELRMDGFGPYQVSVELGIPETTVRRDFKALEQEEAKGRLAEVREQRRSELYKRCLRVIHKAEEHRREALRPGVVEKDFAEQGSGKERARLEKIQAGPNVGEANRALTIQLDAIGKMTRLYGLDVQAHELSGSGGGDIGVSHKLAGIIGNLELPKEVATKLDAFLESIVAGDAGEPEGAAKGAD